MGDVLLVLRLNGENDCQYVYECLHFFVKLEIIAYICKGSDKKEYGNELQTLSYRDTEL